MTHQPRKRFGQNFLQNKAIIHQIIQAFNPQPTERILEIGPGLGALTAPLLRQAKQLTAIEIDRDLHAHLTTLCADLGALHLLNADALAIDYREFGPHLRLIGNLPYNISTPLLIHLLHYTDCIDDMSFMLQKEVVDRVVALPGCKAYGRLSVMVQYHCAVESLFDVPPSAFYPEPKVDSAIIRLTPYRTRPYPAVDLAQLERVTKQAFSMRRKTLANNLKPLLARDALIALGIDPQRRPETLSVAEFVQLAIQIPNS